MRKQVGVALVALALLAVATQVAVAQAVIVPSPVPSCSNGDTLVWNTASSNFLCTTSAAASQPLSDAFGLIKNASNGTKVLAFNVAAISSATTRTWTIPDANITVPSTIASLAANTFTGSQTMNGGFTATTGSLSSTLSVSGAVTGGTYNGQDIDATANFTGYIKSADYVESVNGFQLASANVAGTRPALSAENTNTGTTGRVHVVLQNSIGSLFMQMNSSGFTPSGIDAANAGVLKVDTAGGLAVGAVHASGTLRFFAGGATERGRWSTFPGYPLAINTTSQITGVDHKLAMSTASGDYGFAIKNLSASANTIAVSFFSSTGGSMGNITMNSDNTTVTYNTSSDKRLKDDLGVITPSSERAWVIASLLRATRIHDFSWKASGAPGVGVFAQEAVWVNPRAVTPGKDDIDAAGRPIFPWSVDYSKYVPDLIVGWQLLDDRYTALEHRVRTLEQKGQR